MAEINTARPPKFIPRTTAWWVDVEERTVPGRESKTELWRNITPLEQAEAIRGLYCEGWLMIDIARLSGITLKRVIEVIGGETRKTLQARKHSSTSASLMGKKEFEQMHEPAEVREARAIAAMQCELKNQMLWGGYVGLGPPTAAPPENAA